MPKYAGLIMNVELFEGDSMHKGYVLTQLVSRFFAFLVPSHLLLSMSI